MFAQYAYLFSIPIAADKQVLQQQQQRHCAAIIAGKQIDENVFDMHTNLRGIKGETQLQLQLHFFIMG